MGSIRNRFVALSLLCILLCSGIIGGVSLWSISRTQADSSDQIMQLTCLRQANRLNQQLLDIQSSVDSCAEVMADELDSLESLSDEQRLASYAADVERLVGSIARNTSGVCTYYLRIALDLTKEPVGFFYTKQGRSTSFVKQPLTDISSFDPSDTEHVGWYYQPIEAQKPLWMEPYYNQNIDVYMVSYVVPIYYEGRFLGIVGMDVDFDYIINTVKHMKPYSTGTAFLVSREGTVYYHPDLEVGDSIAVVAPDLQHMVDQLPSLEQDESGEIYSYKWDGIKRKLTYCGLRNNMVLMLTADTDEIYAPLYALAKVVIATTLLISLIAVLAVLRASRRITRPLLQLTEAAGQVAQGNLDVILPEPTNDEVGILSKSLGVMVESLRGHIANMRDMAYKDGLTMVKNKSAFDLAAERLDGEICDGTARFALVMLDVNYLKLVNDEYGHDRGDDYLRNSCHLICKVFDHSPVFRVGGDEFVVLLEHGDYDHRDELLSLMEAQMKKSQALPDAWERISMAHGLSVYKREDASVDEVLRRADQAMYERKREMKAVR